MRTRRWLLGVSIGIHVALLATFVIKGVWGIERLDPGRLPSLAVIQPFELQGGSGPTPTAGRKPADPRKPHKVKPNVLVQPVAKPTEPQQVAAAGPTGGGQGEGPGTAPGLGSGDGSGQVPGACAQPPCGDPPPPPPPPLPVGPAKLPPQVLAGLRTEGDTQIQPSDPTKLQIRRDGKSRVTATFKVCISATGAIDSAHLLVSSHYDDYDRALAAAIGTWRYRPYSVDGHAIPACSGVTFVFAVD